jgi:hypothetical protein
MHAIEGLATNVGDEALDMTLEWAVMLAGAASGVAAGAASGVAAGAAAGVAAGAPSGVATGAAAGVAAGAAAGSLEADALTTTPEEGSTVPLPVLMRDVASLRFSLSTGTAAAAAAAASGTAATEAQHHLHAAGLSSTFEAPRGVSVDDRG